MDFDFERVWREVETQRLPLEEERPLLRVGREKLAQGVWQEVEEGAVQQMQEEGQEAEGAESSKQQQQLLRWPGPWEKGSGQVQLSMDNRT